MTQAQLTKLAKQLRAGADGYAILSRAVAKSVVGDAKAVQRAIENMERLRRELDDQAFLASNPPAWLREVKL